MNKKRVNFFILIGFAVLSFWAAFGTYNDAKKLDLNKASTLKGSVTEAFITDKVTIGLKINTTQSVFAFRLKGNNRLFAIHMFNGAYGDFQRDIQKGDSIKVRYSESSDQYNTNVYQVENKVKIIYNLNTYKKQQASKAGIMAIGGLVILMLAFLFFTSFNVIAFLMRLIEVK